MQCRPVLKSLDISIHQIYHALMIVRKAFKFKLKPTPEHRQTMTQTAGCVRLVWNKSLAKVKESLDNKDGYKGYVPMAGELKNWKKEESTSFLKLVHSQPLQQVLKDLDRAIRDGFKKKKGFPSFKKRGKDKAFRYPQGVKVEEDKVYLPKIGWVKFQDSREIEGEIKNTTVSFYAGHWYIAFQTEFEKEEPIHSSTSEVGIDLGIAKFATVSDGQEIAPLNSLRMLENDLSKAQKSLARKQKGSNNRKEQKYKVQKIHKKIVNVRQDFLHKVSTNLSKNHAVIVLEDLRIRNMSSSAKGTIEDPGKNVKAKSGLNKSILDQGWYEFRRMLEYKQEWRGGKVIVIPAHYTSQKCSKCGWTEKANRKTQANFSCVKCGHTENADLNAAKNILAVGSTVIACGDINSVAS